MRTRSYAFGSTGKRPGWSFATKLAWVVLVVCGVIAAFGGAMAQTGPTARAETREVKCLFVASLAYAGQPAALAARRATCVTALGPAAEPDPAPSPLGPAADGMRAIKLAANAFRLSLDRPIPVEPTRAEEMRQIKRQAVAFMIQRDGSQDVIEAYARRP